MAEAKYGRWGHPPRCNCPDCMTTFVEHNRQRACDCIDCTYTREIGAPAPPVTVQQWGVATAPPFRGHTVHTETYGKTESGKRAFGQAIQDAWNQRKEKKMAGLHMCERKDCSSLIRGEATALLDFMPNTLGTTARKGYELCPGCAEDVHTLLSTAPLSERVRAYDEPFNPEAPRKGSDAVQDATAEQLAAALFEKLMRQASLSATPHTIVDQDED